MSRLLKYQRGAIYTIRSPNTDRFYIGSTVQPLNKRLGDHRGAYEKYQNGNSNYNPSFEVLEAGNYYIEMLEVFPCNTKRELQDRVIYWIRNHERNI